jgi:hypothetical protein
MRKPIWEDAARDVDGDRTNQRMDSSRDPSKHDERGAAQLCRYRSGRPQNSRTDRAAEANGNPKADSEYAQQVSFGRHAGLFCLRSNLLFRHNRLSHAGIVAD